LALLSGDEAVAMAAFEAGVKIGTGYPGTPSTEILETFAKLGGKAQWAPNEKVALEVGVGVAFAGARALVTMKHVGLNVAADPLFTVAYIRLDGALVVVSADDLEWPQARTSRIIGATRRPPVSRCLSPPTRRKLTNLRCKPSKSPSAGKCRFCCA